MLCKLPLLLTVALSAFMSTPSSSAHSDTQIPLESLPHYEGDRKILNCLVALLGEGSIPQDAKSVNDIFTDDFFLKLDELMHWSFDTLKLGELMRELEPDRFDELYSIVSHNPTCYLLVEGYGKDCKWSKARTVTSEGILTKENAPFFLNPSAKLCELMADRPTEFLCKRCMRYCLEIWLESRPDLVRQVLHQHPDLFSMPSIFEGYEDEFVEWFINSVKNGRLTMSINLPKTLKMEHLLKIKDFLSSHLVFIPCVGHEFSDEELKKEVDAIDALVINYTRRERFGFDSHLFNGRYVVANRKIFRHSVISYLDRSHPMDLQSALSAALEYGHYAVLKNTIDFITALSPKQASENISKCFWQFIECAHDDNISLSSWGQAFALVKGHFTRIPPLRSQKCLLKPLFEDMLRSPSLYWPPSLEESGNEWAQAALDAIPKSAEEATAQRNRIPAFTLLKFALKNGWNEMAKGLLSEPTIQYILDHDSLLDLTERFGKENVRKELAPGLRSSLKVKLGSIAQSSSMWELEGFLLISTPHEILAHCGTPFLRKRIGLMLHLIPWLHSYTADGKMVVKTSLFFRDWVMIRLFTKSPADLSLLFYFWRNLLMRVYAGDPVSEDRVFALAGQGNPQKDPMLTRDLLFETPLTKDSGVPKVEEVKDDQI